MSSRGLVGRCFLGLVGLFALFGLLPSGREYSRVHPDYVRTSPSFRPHPTPEETRSALVRVASRMRARVEAVTVLDGEARIWISSKDKIDTRGLVYFERSDAFGAARLLDSQSAGKRMEVVAPLRRLWLPLGTDANGRDLVARLMLAGQVSLLVGALGSAVALIFGASYGMISGFAGGRVDLTMMRVVDALYALPFIFFVILLTAFFGQKFVIVFVAIGAVEWLDMARLARGQTLSLKSREFVVAARALGASPSAILRRHIAPNLAGVAFAYLAVLAPRVILVESFLSFLGLGVHEPLTSVGVLLAEGARHLQDAPWMLVAPATVLLLLLYGFAFVGEGAVTGRHGA